MSSTVRRRHERGAVLAAVGIALLTFFALAAVGVDIGRLAFTAAEVQTVADAAATAGAKAILDERDPDADARAVGALNNIDGTPTASGDLDVLLGNFDFDSNAFAQGGTPINAVRAVGNREVTNIWASVVGSANTTVVKQATAAVGAPCSGRPTLPLALGDCYFPCECYTAEDCQQQGCLPTQTHDSTSDNSAWTGYFDGANKDTILGYIPAPCGGGLESPAIAIDDPIQITNGDLTPLYAAIQCLVCEQNEREFLVPIIECPNGNFNQTQPVKGFATVTVNRIHYTSPGPTGTWAGPEDPCRSGGRPDKIEWKALFRTDPADLGGIGCESFGLLKVALVE
jgi:Flp pilus assembly protein TadG